MFQNLRTNSQVYVLHKNDNPSIEVATITEVSKPDAFAMPMMAGIAKPEGTITITAKIGGKDTTFTGLPYMADVMDYPSRSMLIATTREAMNMEVSNLKHKSMEAINSMDYHKHMVESCDKLLQDLNPEYAERQSQREEINCLKEQMGRLLGMVEKIVPRQM